MARNRAKAKPTSNKKRTCLLSDGWTQVIRGPHSKNPGLSTPHSVPPAPGITIETLQSQLQRYDRLTSESVFRVEMDRLLRQRAEALQAEKGKEYSAELLIPDCVKKGPDSIDDQDNPSQSLTSRETIVDPINKQSQTAALEPMASVRHLRSCRQSGAFGRVILLAIGSPSHPSSEIKRVSMIQLAAAESWVRLLRATGVLGTKAMKIAQDPAFNGLDKRFLEGLGWSVVASPEAERTVATKDNATANSYGTILIAPHLEETVLSKLLESWTEGPGIMIGNDLGIVEERSQLLGEAKVKPKGITWWQGWDRIKPAASEDPVNAREWFGISLHWKP